MAIPIISDIIGTIQKVIDWVQRTIPRPVQFLFFLLFLLFIGNTLFPIFFNTMGTFCIEGDKYTNDFYDVTTNIATTFKIMGLPDDLNTSLGTIDVELNCLFYLSNGTNATRWYDGSFCTNCSKITSSADPAYASALTDDNMGMCGSDAYKIPDNNKTFLQRWLCEGKGEESVIAFGCEPPEGFHFDLETVTYICHDLTICANTTEGAFIKQSLQRKGFTIYPTDTSADPPIVGTKCFHNTPKFVVVGIDIFNFSIWLMLLLIMLLLIVWFRFK